jgi:hypothetical protein
MPRGTKKLLEDKKADPSTSDRYRKAIDFKIQR